MTRILSYKLEQAINSYWEKFASLHNYQSYEVQEVSQRDLIALRLMVIKGGLNAPLTLFNTPFLDPLAAEQHLFTQLALCLEYLP